MTGSDLQGPTSVSRELDATRSGARSFWLRQSAGWVAMDAGAGRSRRVESSAAIPTAAEWNAALRAIGWQPSEPVQLPVGSEHCLAAALETSTLPRPWTVELLTFELERYLPWSSDEVVADFSSGPDSVMGVAILRSAWEPILHSLAAAGVWIQDIRPAAVVLGGPLLRATENGDPSVCIQLQLDQRTELLLWRDEALVAWHSCTDPGLAAATLDLWREEHRIQHLEVRQDRAAQAAEGEAGAGTFAEELLFGTGQRGSPGPISWRRGPFADQDRFRHLARELRWLAGSVVAALLCCLGAVLWQAHLEARSARQLQERQADIFRQLFPKQPLPAGVLSRLQSEARLAEATRGATSQAVQPGDASETLSRFLAAIPAELRVRVGELRVTERQLVTTLECRSQAEAIQIRRVFETVGFEVRGELSIQQLPGGVSMPLELVLAASAMDQSNARSAAHHAEVLP